MDDTHDLRPRFRLVLSGDPMLDAAAPYYEPIAQDDEGWIVHRVLGGPPVRIYIGQTDDRDHDDVIVFDEPHG